MPRIIHTWFSLSAATCSKDVDHYCQSGSSHNHKLSDECVNSGIDFQKKGVHIGEVSTVLPLVAAQLCC